MCHCRHYSYDKDRTHYMLSFPLFFFSSRRRHTRCGRDWSSDVCSSDLDHPPEGRSCFQVVRWNNAGVAESEDLVNAGLDIYQGTIDIFSALLKEVFRVLSDATTGDNLRGGN